MAYHGLWVIGNKSNRKQTYLDIFSITFFIFVANIAVDKHLSPCLPVRFDRSVSGRGLSSRQVFQVSKDSAGFLWAY